MRLAKNIIVIIIIFILSMMIFLNSEELKFTRHKIIQIEEDYVELNDKADSIYLAQQDSLSNLRFKRDSLKQVLDSLSQ